MYNIYFKSKNKVKSKQKKIVHIKHLIYTHHIH